MFCPVLPVNPAAGALNPRRTQSAPHRWRLVLRVLEFPAHDHHATGRMVVTRQLGSEHNGVTHNKLSQTGWMWCRSNNTPGHHPRTPKPLKTFVPPAVAPQCSSLHPHTGISACVSAVEQRRNDNTTLSTLTLVLIELHQRLSAQHSCNRMCNRYTDNANLTTNSIEPGLEWVLPSLHLGSWHGP